LYFCVVSLNPTSQAPFPFLPQSFILCIFIFQSSLFSFFSSLPYTFIRTAMDMLSLTNLQADAPV
jgi:hypothetical protein